MQETCITERAPYYGAVFVLSFLCFLSAVLTPLSGCSKSKEEPRIHTVGLMSCNPRFNQVMEGMKSGLAQDGFVEGRNIKFVDRINIRCEDVEAEMREMVRNEVDLILVSSSLLAKVARDVTAESGTPVVFAPVSDVIKIGIARSFTHHEGNITGVQMGGSMAKALEWHTRALPKVKKILVPYNQSDLSVTGSLEHLEKAAEKLGITLMTRKADSPAELRAAFAKIPPGTGAIWLLPSNFLDSNYELFVDASKTHKLPVSTSTAVFSSIKPFLSYGPDLEKMGKQASRLAGMILNGINPGDIPIEHADFFLTINMAVAGELGIEVPKEILQQAHQIIR